MKLSGDRLFAFLTIILMVMGIAMFSSAALGLLARADGAPWKLAVTQLVVGLLPGIAILIAIRFMDPKLLLKCIVPLYVGSIILTALVFVPGLGLTTNGATRWLDLKVITVQPAEFLKIGVILMLSAYLANMKHKIREWKYGLLPLGLIVGIPSLILLAQPNTSTVLIIGATSVALYFLAGARLRDFLVIGLVCIVALAGLIATRPYLMSRVTTFFSPSDNALTSGYQIQQSLIAIGSGGVLGRGYGQSVQKFNYLPEPVGDSVFAVYGEEFGFLGAVFLILLFAAFAARGLMIAAEASNTFGALAASGLTLLITFSAFMNIGAMLGVLPLTGLPLPFVSHGGTALVCVLASVGIILNIAAHRTKRRKSA